MRFTIAAALAFLASSVSAQVAPTCTPNDVACIITSAQYTVLGTVTANNANSSEPGASATNYNATMQIDCVYSSFGTNKGTGANFINQSVKVINFGNPKAGCPNGLGANAIVGTQSIYFIAIANTVGQGAIPTFTVFNPCGGALENSKANQQIMADVLAKFPQNVIPGSPQCALLPATAPTTTAGVGASPTGASAPAKPTLALGDGANGSQAVGVSATVSAILLTFASALFL
ncbi:hypothetical protein PhCBS80983_g02419 [Powellomyces hirtus]|uniref:Uncharacterized protein n=1 Tax=Powellomyces hirtus TaxID=109895 RepID=A0A507E639_9FUNG|nr:hypothetical protein PhCBS80983_g02419 [Powellomyces hirtus]